MISLMRRHQWRLKDEQHTNLMAYLEYHRRPLMERDPLRAWKILAGLLAISQIVTLFLLLN